MLRIFEERIFQVEKIGQRARSSREITWDRKKKKKPVWLEQSKQVGNESDLGEWEANIIEPHKSL